MSNGNKLSDLVECHYEWGVYFAVFVNENFSFGDDVLPLFRVVDTETAMFCAV
jgi:hypothetical protein